MRVFIIFALFAVCIIGNAQEYQIEIRLVDPNVGYPTGDPITNDYQAVSNDPGLNAIFNIYDATHYYPSSNVIPAYEDKTHYVLCNGCDINQFEQDLINYDSVIEHTIQSQPGLTSNEMYLRLVDLANGFPLGVNSDGIIITNNDDLNVIFEDFKVMVYEQVLPGASNPLLKRSFYLGCDCLVVELMPVLDALTDVIEFTEGPLGYPVLGTQDQELNNFRFFPNPVDEKLLVQTSETIESYYLYDLGGKEITRVENLDNLNEVIPTLHTGTYFLKIVTQNQQMGTYRLIKQ